MACQSGWVQNSMSQVTASLHALEPTHTYTVWPQSLHLHCRERERGGSESFLKPDLQYPTTPFKTTSNRFLPISSPKAEELPPPSNSPKALSWVAMNFFFCAGVRDLSSSNWRCSRNIQQWLVLRYGKCILKLFQNKNQIHILLKHVSHFQNPTSTKGSLLKWDFSFLRK